MDLEFGDIYRYDRIDHFILIMGFDETEKEILYVPLSSKVYRPFSELRNFFNDHCISKCDIFIHNFFKKKEVAIAPARVRDCYFIDKDRYATHLSYDSVMVFNKDIDSIKKKDFEYFQSQGDMKYQTSLDEEDIVSLEVLISYSENISPSNKKIIKKSYKDKKQKIFDGK